MLSQNENTRKDANLRPSSAGQAALRRAVIASAALSALKFGLGLSAGSTLVMASAADSFSDAAVSAINMWGHKQARAPADSGHPWGHGKIEGAVAMGQGMLLLGISASLVAAGVTRLAEGVQMPALDIAAATVLGSGVGSSLIAAMLKAASKKEPSVVLDADAAHYRTDLWAAGAALGGLGLARATGIAELDPIFSLIIAAMMAKEALGVLRSAVRELLDESIGAEEVAKVEAILAEHAEIAEFHDLRTRRSGPDRFIEVHARLPPEMTLAEAHLLVQDIGRELREAVPGSRVLVHPDAKGLADLVS